MKKLGFVMLAVVLMTVLMPIDAAAQEDAQIEWLEQFSGSAGQHDRANAVDTDGNIYVAGYTYGTFPGQQHYGSTDGSDYQNSLHQPHLHRAETGHRTPEKRATTDSDDANNHTEETEQA